MNKYLDNFNRLFSPDDKIAYQAILEKKDWILKPLYIKGNLSISIDQEGKKHFDFLESLLNDVLLFLDKENSKIPTYKYVKFQQYLDMKKDDKFFVEYDFNKIDQKGYQTLVANFYPCIEDLKLDENSANPQEVIKTYMKGNENEAVLVLEESLLLNNSFYAPVLVALHVNKNCDETLKDTLKEIALKKNIKYYEIDVK